MFKCFLLIMLTAAANTQQSRRTLLLFADNSAQALLKTQQVLLQVDAKGLQDRDIDIKIYSPKDAPIWKSNHVLKGFTIILVGKDGGEKLRSHQPITAKKLFGIIDAMPMRKEEMIHAGTY